MKQYEILNDPEFLKIYNDYKDYVYKNFIGYEEDKKHNRIDIDEFYLQMENDSIMQKVWDGY